MNSAVQGTQLKVPGGFSRVKAEAFACQQLDFGVNLVREDGVVVPRFANEDDLMMAYPAPNCPFAENAWIAGTQVELWALGNPLGYQFEGWAGEAGAGARLVGDPVAGVTGAGGTDTAGTEAAGTEAVATDLAGSELAQSLGDNGTFLLDEDFPPGIVTTVTMDGTSPIKQIQAQYRVQCHTVTVEGFASRVEWYPAPNCPGFEGEVTYEQYSHSELFGMYGGTQAGQARQYGKLEKMAGPKSMTGRFVGGTEVLLQTGDVSSKVWKGWGGDVVTEGRINPTSVLVEGDSFVQNRFRDMSTGEQLDSFGNDMAIFGKKLVGFSAVVLTEYVTKYPPIGVVGMVAETMSLVGTLLEASGISKSDVAFMHYAKQFNDMLFAPLSCASTWALGSADAGAVRGLAGIAAEQAKQKTYRITDVLDAQASQALQAKNMMTTGDTGFAMAAKLKYYQAKLGVATLSKKIMPAVSVGLAIYGAAQGGGVSWDKDAKSAWTDGSAYTNCIKKAVPDFVHSVADVNWEQTMLDYGESLRQTLGTQVAQSGGASRGYVPRRRPLVRGGRGAGDGVGGGRGGRGSRDARSARSARVGGLR